MFGRKYLLHAARQVVTLDLEVERADMQQCTLLEAAGMQGMQYWGQSCCWFLGNELDSWEGPELRMR